MNTDKAYMVIQHCLIILVVIFVGLLGWSVYNFITKGPEKCVKVYTPGPDGYTQEEKCWREKEGPK